jgi:hypothetical protein
MNSHRRISDASEPLYGRAYPGLGCGIPATRRAPAYDGASNTQERVQHCVRGLVPAVERIEHGDPVLAGDHRLAVHSERFGTQLGRGRGDGGIAIGPIMAAAGKEAHGWAVPAHDQSIAVVLDLVHPVGTRRRLGGQGRNAGVDEAVGADAARCHGGELAACSRGPQPPLGGHQAVH